MWLLIVIAAWGACLYLQCWPIRRRNRAIKEGFAEQTMYANYWTHADIVNKISLVRMQQVRLRDVVRPIRAYPLAFFTLSAPIAAYAAWDSLHLHAATEETDQVRLRAMRTPFSPCSAYPRVCCPPFPKQWRICVCLAYASACLHTGDGLAC